jgi:hypothetical protein
MFHQTLLPTTTSEAGSNHHQGLQTLFFTETEITSMCQGKKVLEFYKITIYKQISNGRE